MSDATTSGGSEMTTCTGLSIRDAVACLLLDFFWLGCVDKSSKNASVDILLMSIHQFHSPGNMYFCVAEMSAWSWDQSGPRQRGVLPPSRSLAASMQVTIHPCDAGRLLLEGQGLRLAASRSYDRALDLFVCGDALVTLSDP